MKFKKFLAFVCAATMLVPSVAFADTTTGDGTGSVENDNSSIARIGGVTLPTVATGTYNFTLDPEELLNQYDENAIYDDDATAVFFQTVTPAHLTAIDSNLFYEKSYSDITDGFQDVLDDTITADDSTFAIATDGTISFKVNPFASTNYAIWVPESTTSGKTTTLTGNGTMLYLKDIAVDKLANYFKVEASDTSDVTTITVSVVEESEVYTTGDYIWNGKFYEEDYREITGEAAYNLITKTTACDLLPATAADVAKATLFVSSDATTYTGVTNDVRDTYFTVTAASYEMTGTTNTATIVNKCSQNIGVSVAVTATNTTGLTFTTDDAFTDDKNASVYLALNSIDKDGNTEETLKMTDKLNMTAYYVLEGYGSKNTKYQGSLNTDTGSHNYYTYLDPVTKDMEYNQVSFNIEAKANAISTAGVKDEDKAAAWATYTSKVTSKTRPSLKVVYSFDYVSDEDFVDTDGDTTNDISVYKDASGNMYKTSTAVEDSNNGGVASYRAGEITPYIVTGAKLTHTIGETSDIVVDLGEGAKKASDVIITYGSSAKKATEDASSIGFTKQKATATAANANPTADANGDYAISFAITKGQAVVQKDLTFS
ncbi:MAG: hypothetical protein IKJ01_05915, partial [Lachnospiraceae bacterium]|nr:hypothetical protein [Lachnospiraceae bacterium]